MICYFSGTGNSQRVAKQIAEQTKDTIVSINSSLRGKAPVCLQSESPLVFVAPVYAWRLPRVVEQWILDTQFHGCQQAYFVLTCGDSAGNASHYVQRLCQKKGFSFSGLAQVVMPENYIAMFPTPSKEQADAILEASNPHVASIAEHIHQGETFPETKPSLLGNLQSRLINPLFYSFFVKDTGFTVTDACIGCGKCDRKCPLGNIAMQEQRPVWKGNCTHCMTCICACPTEAIEYKAKTKGQARYYIMEED